MTSSKSPTTGQPLDHECLAQDVEISANDGGYSARVAAVSRSNVAKRAVSAVVALAGRHVFLLLAGIIIARSLGPTGYGNFAFLLAGFATLHTLLDLSMSQAFYTTICRDHWPLRFFLGYGGWIALQLIVPVVAIMLVLPADWVSEIWRGQARELIILAFVASFSQRVLWQMVVQIGESLRLTVRVQSATVVIMATYFLTVVVLSATGRLSMSVLFIALAAEFAIGSVVILLSIRSHHGANTSTSEIQVSKTLHALLAYAWPLWPSLIAVAVNGFIETWFLQIFGGPAQQAYFGVSQQYANLAMVIGVSTTNVFWKELAAAHARGDVATLQAVYRQSARVLFVAVTFVCAFAVFWASEIIHLLLGPAYAGAAPAFALTLLNAIFQSFGVAISIAYLATGRTRAWSVYQIMYVAVSIPGSYIALWLLHLGAVGLAAKLLILSVIAQLGTDWYFCRLYRWKTDNLFRLLVGAGLLALGGTSFLVVDLLLGAASPIVRFFAGAVVYGLITVPAGVVVARRMGYGADIEKAWRKIVTTIRPGPAA